MSDFLHKRHRARALLLRAAVTTAVLSAMLSACAPAPVRNPLATWVASPNLEEDARNVIDAVASLHAAGPH